MNDKLSTYQSFERELFSLIDPNQRFSAAQNLKLERIKHLLASLGNPQDSYASIHIGGTSGKGSTAVIVSSILRKQGYDVGLHISPHLQILNERFQINNQMVSTSFLSSILQDMQPKIDKVAQENPFGKPSYFEVQVALAFLLFKQRNVDVAVIEVGLGGTLDATNVLKSSVAVLTSVGLDHTEILGDTIEKIASDKVGIIKANQIVVSSFTQSTARRIIKEKCHEENAELLLADRDFAYQYEESQSFKVSIKNHTIGNLNLGLAGDFQCANAACAITAALAFDPKLSHRAIQKGLEEVAFPGRFEIIQENPLVVLDGAHNPDKIMAILESIKMLQYKRLLTVLSLKDDKDYEWIVKLIAHETDHLIVTAFEVKELFKPLLPEVISQEARQIRPDLNVEIIYSPTQAIEEALNLSDDEDLILVTGSLYLVGDVRSFWHPIESLLAELHHS